MVLTNAVLSSIKTAVKTQIITDFTHVDFGTGTTAVTSADTDMETSVVRNARQDYTSLSNDIIISGFLGSGQANGSSITEIGCFDAASAGNMQEHALITAVVKTSSKELWIDIRNKLTVTQS